MSAASSVPSLVERRAGACRRALSTAPVDCTCLVEAPSFLPSSTSTGRCVDPSSAASRSVAHSRAPLERVAPDNDWSVALRFFLGSAAGGGSPSRVPPGDTREPRDARAFARTDARARSRISPGTRHAASRVASPVRALPPAPAAWFRDSRLDASDLVSGFAATRARDSRAWPRRPTPATDPSRLPPPDLRSTKFSPATKSLK